MGGRIVPTRVESGSCMICGAGITAEYFFYQARMLEQYNLLKDAKKDGWMILKNHLFCPRHSIEEAEAYLVIKLLEK